jgi:tetratricopeptide (TPR) repeat protein
MAHQKCQKWEEATHLFADIEDFYQAGYSQLLAGSLYGVQVHWMKLPAIRANHWCLSLYGLVTGQLTAFPTFLQVRNHLEADIILLSRANQTSMVNNLLRFIDTLATINFEAYKFTGRALFYVKRMDDVEEFLLKGQKLLPGDPEVYYHLGQYYHAMGDSRKCRLALQQCLMISPTYTPAQELLVLTQS